MLTYILIALAVIVIAFVAVVAMQSPTFRIVRSKSIGAQAPVVFAQVNDFHRWDAWSPWAKLDPTMKQFFEGAPAGRGAIYRWNGNGQVGEGRMEITDSQPNKLVEIQLDFMKPMKATNQTLFTFEPQGDQTVVTWDMRGNKNFMAKAFHLFVNMDKMLGGQFDQGLTQLEAAAKTAAHS